MISLDDETCISCGLCVEHLPQYFEVADGKVRVRPGLGDSAPEASAVAEAVEDCPSGALRD